MIARLKSFLNRKFGGACLYCGNALTFTEIADHAENCPASGHAKEYSLPKEGGR